MSTDSNVDYKALLILEKELGLELEAHSLFLDRKSKLKLKSKKTA
jgi:hypothetical protein